MAASSRSFRLLTVNTTPERAKRVVGRLTETLKDRYNITHVDNCQSEISLLLCKRASQSRLTNDSEIDEVTSKVELHKPDVLFSASMWTPEEHQQIHSLARAALPNIKLLAIPTGLHVDKGPDGIIEFLKEQAPKILDA
ncbi:unnamed protein product [Clonostachys byssicola]|uniref:Uncharacterized protein n=1 Tax=Clonostachys byssicola TaxID=160290 RepID=A0A9N9Y0S5_9HYPO|nr:unnamed protein product [Clonostachys byssicola]